MIVAILLFAILVLVGRQVYFLYASMTDIRRAREEFARPIELRYRKINSLESVAGPYTTRQSAEASAAANTSALSS